MKIAILSISNGRVDRGAEVWVTELAKRLQKKHETVVFQSGRKLEKGYTQRSIGGVSFQPHQTSGWSIFYHLNVLVFTLRCLPALWKERYDWVIPINGYSQAVLCRVLQWMRGGHMLIAGHAGVGRDDRFNIMFGKPDVFVALTKQACDWAKKIGRTRIAYIANGVDTEIFCQEGKNATISLKKPIVLCVSALVPYKRIDLLIYAVEKTDASLLLIGDGSERESVISLGNKRLGDRFTHIAHVPHAEMPVYYRAADVFSLPSKESEAFGLVYLEAMACNVPVVAPDDDNRRILIGGGGMLCQVENGNEYASALEKALSAKWNNKPRTQAEKYSWETIVRQYEDIFDIQS